MTRIRAGLRIQDLTPGSDNDFSLLHNIRTNLNPTPPHIRRKTALSVEVKVPRRQTDHSPPPGATVKNTWSVITCVI